MVVTTAFPTATCLNVFHVSLHPHINSSRELVYQRTDCLERPGSIRVHGNASEIEIFTKVNAFLHLACLRLLGRSASCVFLNASMSACMYILCQFERHCSSFLVYLPAVPA